MNILPSVQTLEQACQSMPIFPLPRVVLFPGTLLRLHVFEPRYVQLLEHIQEKDKLFCIPMMNLNGVQAEPVQLHPVAGVGKVIQCTALPENRYNIIVLGVGRILLQQEQFTTNLYRKMQGRLLSEASESYNSVPLRQLLMQLVVKKPSLEETLRVLLSEEISPRMFVNTVAQVLLDSAEEKQLFWELESIEDQDAFLAEIVANNLFSGGTDFTA